MKTWISLRKRVRQRKKTNLTKKNGNDADEIEKPTEVAISNKITSKIEQLSRIESDFFSVGFFCS